MADRDRAERLFLLALVVLFGWLAFLIFRPFLDWVIFGFLFAYLAHRPYRATLRIVRRRGIAAGLVLLLIFVLFFAPFVIVVTLLFQDVTQFGLYVAGIDIDAAIASVLLGVAQFFGTTFDTETLASATDTITRAVRSRFASFAAGFAANLFRFIATLFIGFFVFGFTVYYGLIDGRRLINGVLWATPLHQAEKDHLIHEVKSVIDAVIIGHVLLGVIQGVVGGLGFYLFGVPNAILWGFIMLILSLIPFVGPFVVWIPIGVFLLVTEGDVDGVFTTNRTVAGLGILLLVGPVTSSIDNILRPKITAMIAGEGTYVHPFSILIGALGGLVVFGFAGLVTGPLILSLFIAVVRVYRHHWSESEEDHEAHAPLKGLPPERAKKPPKARKRRRKKRSRKQDTPSERDSGGVPES